MSLFKRKTTTILEDKTASKQEFKEEIKSNASLDSITIPSSQASVYRILKRPHVTEKAQLKDRQYVFVVNKSANKSELKKSIENLYSVNIASIRTLKTFGKRRQLGRTEGWKPGLKKAIVTLSKGQKIDLGTN